MATVPIDGQFLAEYDRRISAWRASAYYDPRYINAANGLHFNCDAIATDLAGTTSQDQVHRALAACDAHLSCAAASAIVNEWHFPGWREHKGKDQDALNEALDILSQGYRSLLSGSRRFDLTLTTHACRFFFGPIISRRWQNAIRKAPLVSPESCLYACRDGRCDGYQSLRNGDVAVWERLCGKRRIMPRKIASYVEHADVGDKLLPTPDEVNGLFLAPDEILMPGATALPHDFPTERDIERMSRVSSDLRSYGIELSNEKAQAIDAHLAGYVEEFGWKSVAEMLGKKKPEAVRKLVSRTIHETFHALIDRCLLNGLLVPEGPDLDFARHASWAQSCLDVALKRAWDDQRDDLPHVDYNEVEKHLLGLAEAPGCPSVSLGDTSAYAHYLGWIHKDWEPERLAREAFTTITDAWSDDGDMNIRAMSLRLGDHIGPRAWVPHPERGQGAPVKRLTERIFLTKYDWNLLAIPSWYGGGSYISFYRMRNAFKKRSTSTALNRMIDDSETGCMWAVVGTTLDDDLQYAPPDGWLWVGADQQWHAGVQKLGQEPDLFMTLWDTQPMAIR